MCVVSAVGADYTRRWAPPPATDTLTRVEFDKLRRDVLEMKELLRKAKEIDTALGTPDCEEPDKVAILKQIAKLVGVDLEDLLD